MICSKQWLKCVWVEWLTLSPLSPLVPAGPWNIKAQEENKHWTGMAMLISLSLSPFMSLPHYSPSLPFFMCLHHTHFPSLNSWYDYTHLNLCPGSLCPKDNTHISPQSVCVPTNREQFCALDGLPFCYCQHCKTHRCISDHNTHTKCSQAHKAGECISQCNALWSRGK